MESQVTTAAGIDLSVLRLKPEHLKFLEILRDSATVTRRNFVPRKPADIIEDQLTDCCFEQVAKAKQVKTLCPVLSSRRRKITYKSAFDIAQLAKLLRSAAIRRSLDLVLSVPTFSRATRLVLKVGQAKVIPTILQLCPVPEKTTTVCKRLVVDINVVVEDVSASGREQEDAVGADTVYQLEETSVPKKIRRRRPILRAIVRRLSKIGRRLCCWCGTPSS